MLRNKNWCFRLCKTVSLLTQSGKFGEARQDLTIKELAEKFLALKETEVAKTSLNTYRAVIKNILSIIGEKNLASSINKEKLLEVRKELLTGYQIPKSNYIVTQPGDRL